MLQAQLIEYSGHWELMVYTLVTVDVAFIHFDTEADARWHALINGIPIVYENRRTSCNPSRSK